MKLISRADARTQGLTRFYTGKPCIYGHVAERLTSNQCCVECANARSRKWKHENLEICTAEKRAWVEKNREKVRALKRDYYAKSETDRQKQAARAKKWYLQNKEKSRANTAKWRSENLDVAAAAQTRRRAAKMNRTPAWADHEKIREVYAKAKDLTATTGVLYHVDHVYPLRGETVSGLHVETNLQVVPAIINWSKNNRLVETSHPS